jgi:hypothetical protein
MDVDKGSPANVSNNLKNTTQKEGWPNYPCKFGTSRIDHFNGRMPLVVPGRQHIPNHSSDPATIFETTANHH